MAVEAAQSTEASPPGHTSHLVLRALAVAVGGALGALLRFGLTGFADPPSAAPLVAVNTGGAFAMGCLFGLGPRPGWPLWLRDGLGTGLLGGFTTMSGLASAALAPVVAGSAGTPGAWILLMMVGSVLLGLPAAGLGWRLAERRN